MKYRLLYLILCIVFPNYTFSQTIRLSGTVKDSMGLYVEAAIVSLRTPADSLIAEPVSTNSEGKWNIIAETYRSPLTVNITHSAYEGYILELDSLTQVHDFGTIKIRKKDYLLQEVVITTSVPRILIKRDTTEFRASAFFSENDGNVADLIRRLPGFEVDTKNNITFNGKKVNEVLVDGKPFFDSQGRALLQNLPPDLIDKIQVSDTKTEAQKISGETGSGETASINLTIKKDRNNGYFGKLLYGQGTDKRYEGIGTMNYFKEKRKISIMGGANNINGSANLDPVFDSMLRGAAPPSSGSGITQTRSAGTSYMDTWKKEIDFTVNYLYTEARAVNENTRRQQNLIPNDPDTEGYTGSSYITESLAKTNSVSTRHNMGTSIKIKTDENSLLSIQPNLIVGLNDNTAASSSQVYENGNIPLNESNSFQQDQSKDVLFSNAVYYFRKMRKKGRSFSVSLNNEIKSQRNEILYKSDAVLYGSETAAPSQELRNQNRYNKRADRSYRLALSYFEPLSDSLKVKINLEHAQVTSLDNKEVYDYNNDDQAYNDYNQLLSNNLRSQIKSIAPAAVLDLQKKNYSGSASLGTTFSTFDNSAVFAGYDSGVTKKYALPVMSLYFTRRISTSKSLSLRYNYSTNFPSARQILPLVDFGNTLYSVVGNPDLDPSQTNTVTLAYRNYNFSKRTGYSIYAASYYHHDQIVNYIEIDENAKQTVTYRNLSGSYSAFMNFNWNCFTRYNVNSVKFDMGLNLNYGKQKSYINANIMDSYTTGISPALSIIYDYGTLATIACYYKPSFEWQNYSLLEFSKNTSSLHRFSLQTTTYWPENFILGHDITYNYSPQISQGFSKGACLWNMSLGYKFMKDNLIFRVKVYDLLDQNINTYRTLSPNEITDQKNTILKRYFLFSLVFKIQDFGAGEN